MEPDLKYQNYVAFLRGINVGGHHKVPMSELKDIFVKMGYNNITTLLNAGNVIFGSRDEDIKNLEIKIARQLSDVFKFPVPILIRTSEEIHHYIDSDPFGAVVMNRDIRLYATLLGEQPELIPKLPWTSPDTAFMISKVVDGAVFSVLDLAKSQSIEAMAVLEKFFGKEITTRNWNTIMKIGNLV